MRVGRLDGKAEHRVLLTSRHHCCEMMATYSLEGLLETVLAGLPGMRLAGSIEIPYANVREQEVTADSARAFGKDLARAIGEYLKREK